MDTSTSTLCVGDTVRINSHDGFNNHQGTLDAITPPPAWNSNSEWGTAYFVDFGMKRYGRLIVPFQRHEVSRVESSGA